MAAEVITQRLHLQETDHLNLCAQIAFWVKVVNIFFLLVIIFVLKLPLLRSAPLKFNTPQLCEQS